ncbi:alpha/beta fold hydrolase [Gordonia phthalatica]|uniref:Alpha/beta hydrolase n=1 Tax=Gordonia phthalatica TaxID=1136941 RepID=A0A0N9N8Q0_9ACTN|nr:alpha/beta fold hydrolase [Gordonia phthalatica]ALG83667.1 alpha/beta hydrolase [Gordonia phthalatica]
MTASVIPDYDETLRELSTDQGVLRYHEFGDGPPLVLLHGSGPGVSGWRNFRSNIGLFGEHFRCLILEFPGFGISDDWGGHPMVTALSALEVFVDQLGLETFDVVGNSMGGGVGIGYDLAHPGRIRRLVTVGGIGRNIFSPGPGEGIKLLQDFTENPTRDALLRWLHSMVWDPATVTEELIEERWALATDPGALESARRMYGRETFAAMIKMMNASDTPPQWAMMHKVTAKTLLTWGRDDRVSPLDMALVPMRTIPNAELHVFPNCGHWAMIEAKAAFERSVMGFLLEA